MKVFLRLLKNFIILSLPLWLIAVFTALYPMEYMSVEYAMWAEERDAVRSSFDVTDPETIIIGDSRAKSGIIPAELDSRAYNISIGGTTSVEMYYAVRNYLKNHEAPKNAVVIFAPYHFCYMDNWGQTQYYNYLTLPEIMDAEINGLKCGEKEVNYNGCLADLLSFKLRLPNKYMEALYSAHLTGNGGKNREKYDSVRRDRGYTAFGEEEYNDGINYEGHIPEFVLSEMTDLYYGKILDLLTENNVNIIIEQAPINEASDKVITDEFMQGYTAYMNMISGRYEKASVEKIVPVYENSYFGDNNHMNKKGALKYTTYIREKYAGTFR